MKPLLTTAEAAREFPVKAKTLRNKKCAGVFVQGVHYRKLGTRQQARIIWIAAALETYFRGEVDYTSMYPEQVRRARRHDRDA